MTIRWSAMVLVLMVVLQKCLLCGAEQNCCKHCKLVKHNVTVKMESGIDCKVETQACEGRCYNPLTSQQNDIMHDSLRTTQISCQFDEWTYISVPDYCFPSPGPDQALAIPWALSCKCQACNSTIYNCEPFST